MHIKVRWQDTSAHQHVLLKQIHRQSHHQMLEYYGRSFSQTASQPTYNAHLALLYYHVNMLVPSSEQSWKRLSLHQMAQ